MIAVTIDRRYVSEIEAIETVLYASSGRAAHNCHIAVMINWVPACLKRRVIVFREVRTVDGRPVCESCDRQMWLLTVRPAESGSELRTFECAKCASSMKILVLKESTAVG